MGLFFLCLIVAAVAAGKARRPKKVVELLYKQGRLDDDYAVFSCGCRYRWSRPDEAPTVCAAHRAIIDSEVSA